MSPSMSAFVRRQTRRKVALEMLSGAVPMSSAVLFSGVFIAGWSWQRSSVAALLTALGLAAYLVWHRSIHPANIDPPPPVEDSEDEEADDDDGRWDWFTILLFVVSLIGVAVVGFVGSFFIPLLVIVLFCIGYSSFDVSDVAAATLAMAGVSAVVEFAVVMPLCKLWNLDPEAGPRPRKDFCPRPGDQS